MASFVFQNETYWNIVAMKLKPTYTFLICRHYLLVLAFFVGWCQVLPGNGHEEDIQESKPSVKVIAFEGTKIFIEPETSTNFLNELVGTVSLKNENKNSKEYKPIIYISSGTVLSGKENISGAMLTYSTTSDKAKEFKPSKAQYAAKADKSTTISKEQVQRKTDFTKGGNPSNFKQFYKVSFSFIFPFSTKLIGNNVTFYLNIFGLFVSLVSIFFIKILAFNAPNQTFKVRPPPVLLYVDE